MISMTKMKLVQARDITNVISEFVSLHIPQVGQIVSITDMGFVYRYRITEISYEIVRDTRESHSGMISDNFCDVYLHCERDSW